MVADIVHQQGFDPRVTGEPSNTELLEHKLSKNTEKIGSNFWVGTTMKSGSIALIAK